MGLFRRMPVWAIVPLCSAAWAQNSPVISLVANAVGRESHHCAEYLGGNQGHAPGEQRRFAHLTELRFSQPSTAHLTRRRQRHRQRQGRLCLLHQPHAGEHSDPARLDAQQRVGGGDQ
jgi:hypothetical protein